MAATFEVAAIIAYMVPVKNDELEEGLVGIFICLTPILIMVGKMVDDVVVEQYFFVVIKTLSVKCLLPMKK